MGSGIALTVVSRYRMFGTLERAISSKNQGAILRETLLADVLLHELDRGGATALSRQVYEIVRQLILSGALKAGDKLPASRSLAKDSGLSRNTLLSAYEHLHAEGYVVCTTGSGTYVSDTVPSNLDLGAEPVDLPAASAPAHLTLSCRGLELVRNAQASSSQWGAFVPGVPDVSLFPFEVWQRLLKRHWKNPSPELLSYAYGAGHYGLRKALSDYLRLARAVRSEPDQIIITNGIHQSISLLATLLADSGQSAWVENPSYWGARTVLRSTGLHTIPVDVDSEGMAPTPEQLSRPPHLVFVTPSHQYPLGCVMSLARRRMLLEYAYRHRCWIIEDDYDSEFRFDGQPIASLQGLDNHDRVIYLGTFSKTLYPGMRMGYMVLPKSLCSHFAVGISDLYREGRLIDQAVLADFIDQGHYATHIRRMKTQYARRQSLLREAIHEVFGEHWPISTREAGLHLVLHLPEGVDDVGIALAARSLNIVVRPLSRYYSAGPAKPGLLFGYASVAEDQIKPLFQRLVQVITPALEHVQRSMHAPLPGATGKISRDAWSGA